MREKYMSLSVSVLRDLAKARGMKGISALKKEQLIERMLEQDEYDSKQSASQERVQEKAQEKLSEKTEQVKEAAENTAVNTRRDVMAEGENTYRRPQYTRTTERDTRNQDQDNRSPERERRNNQDRDSRYNQDRDNRYNQDRDSRYNQDRDQRSNQREDQTNRSRRPQRSAYNNYNSTSGGYSNNGYSSNNNARSNYSTGGAANASSSYGEAPVRTYPPPAPEVDFEAQMREADAQLSAVKEDLSEIDSGLVARGILELHPEGYGFIRSDNYMPGDNDVYVSHSQIRRFNLKTGDIITGNTRVKGEKEKFSALLYVTSVNGRHPSEASRRVAFEDLTPVFPNKRLFMERPGGSVAMRVVDLVSPIGKGQRGMIVSQPKAGKTTLLKEVAKSITTNNPDMKLIILLIDERPEEVTDIKESIEGENVEVIYSTFDEMPEHHKRVSEMVIERAKRLVEHKEDVIILLDSITRLARAYNLTVSPSGRTLSGGLDPAALHMPKKFFGAARNMREGGSLTILATALVDTGSKMDDVVYEEFKGTGNMELVLDRKLSEKRIFPAIDIVKSGTRREDLLLSQEEQAAVEIMRRAINGMKSDEAVENILNMFAHTNDNREFVNMVRKTRILQ